MKAGRPAAVRRWCEWHLTCIATAHQGKKILVKGLKGKKGSYDAYLIPESVEEFSYTKDGKEIIGFQYKFKMEFPQKKDK